MTVQVFASKYRQSKFCTPQIQKEFGEFSKKLDEKLVDDEAEDENPRHTLTSIEKNSLLYPDEGMLNFTVNRKRKREEKEETEDEGDEWDGDESV